ncbi:MAG: hypothetical protein AAF690_28485 [Acidobacteriota bacterium]
MLLGLTSILFGLVVIATRGSMLFVPKTTLRWTHWVLAEGPRRQRLGFALIALGALMILAGWHQDSLHATIVLVFGVGTALFAAVGLLIVPDGLREATQVLEPDTPIGTMMGWRVLGLGGLTVGALFVYGGLLSLGF